ncbi:MAG: hypothetical protein OXT09_09075 [Myxococcales bacterium]|nr:hypothetical protein [Myxococcales bacterium]
MGDPRTVDRILERLDHEQHAAVHGELLGTLGTIVARHLPDARLQPVFERHFDHKKADVRATAVRAARCLVDVPWEAVAARRDDRAAGVREAVTWVLGRGDTCPSWMFDRQVRLEPVPEHLRIEDDDELEHL